MLGGEGCKVGGGGGVGEDPAAQPLHGNRVSFETS